MSTIDTDQMTYAEMKATDEALQSAMDKARKSAQKDALNQIVKVAVDHGLTIEDITSAMSRSSSKGKTRTVHPPKYQDPSGSDQWSGKGRQPKWFVAALDSGIPEEDMLIKN